jgi:putative spermidine/putrescine transport system permease protein
MSNQIAMVQYPPAAASAVLLLVIVSLMVAGILQIVDVRKELTR